MEDIKKQIDVVLEGFFYHFGFIANPAEKSAKSIVKESSPEKIKADLKRINKDYRKKYLEMRKQVFCIEQ
jgi:hypothetical protein